MLQQLKDLILDTVENINPTVIIDDINKDLDRTIANHPQALEEAKYNAKTKANKEAKTLTDRIAYLNTQLIK